MPAQTASSTLPTSSKSSQGRAQRNSRPSTRRSTPAATAPPASSSSKFSSTTSSGAPLQWTEPPLPVPRPSYQEYNHTREADRVSATISMQPIGQLPSKALLDKLTKPPKTDHKGKKGKPGAAGSKAAKEKRLSAISPAASTATVASPATEPQSPSDAVSLPSARTSKSPAAPAVSHGNTSPAPILLPPIPPAYKVPPEKLAQAKLQAGKGSPGLSLSPGAVSASGSTPAASATPDQSGTTTPGKSTSPQSTTPIQQAMAQLSQLQRPSISTPVPRAPPPNVWINGNTPSSKTPQGRQRLTMVVEAAINRALTVGNTDLGMAVRKLYEESKSDESLADLLDCVLAQKANPDQIARFQNYVRTARQYPSMLESKEPFFARLAALERERAGKEGGVHASNVGDLITMRVDPGKLFKPASFHQSSSAFSPPAVNAQLLQHKLQQQQETASNAATTTVAAAEESESGSDMLSTITTTGVDAADDHSSKAPPSTAAPSHASTPQPEMPPENQHLQKQLLPAYEELKKESSIRDPPPAATRTAGRGRKRARSPAGVAAAAECRPSQPQHTHEEMETVQVNTTETSWPTPEPVVDESPEPPKKKSKTSKTKVASADTKKPKATQDILLDPADTSFVTAGVSREANRHSRYGSEGISENDDFCSACSGSGLIICCERCPKSFHLTCTNPPLQETPSGVWFCNECLKREKPPKPAPKGLFCDLLNKIERRNPAAYQLPEGIRNYYKGVSTGKTGQYVAIPGHNVRKGGGSHKYQKHNLQTYTLEKLRDGQPVQLCYHCNKTTLTETAQIIGCDYCPLKWHVDCISPMPMDRLDPNYRYKWKCPAHVDELVAEREPVNAVVVDTHLRRGHRNNGLIEVENEAEGGGGGEGEGEGEQQFEELTMDGVVYKIPERGIKLDFIDAVKRMHETKRRKLDNGGKERRVEDGVVVVEREAISAVEALAMLRMRDHDSLPPPPLPLISQQVTPAREPGGGMVGAVLSLSPPPEGTNLPKQQQGRNTHPTTTRETIEQQTPRTTSPHLHLSQHSPPSPPPSECLPPVAPKLTQQPDQLLAEMVTRLLESAPVEVRSSLSSLSASSASSSSPPTATTAPATAPENELRYLETLQSAIAARIAILASGREAETSPRSQMGGGEEGTREGEGGAGKGSGDKGGAVAPMAPMMGMVVGRGVGGEVGGSAGMAPVARMMGTGTGTGEMGGAGMGSSRR
ncbi:hypothetical protein EX30DRAFT_396580 [Ascodesmis nigricans]|uniref:PHD-type domain-containing protein n=1 Tax=Ascodesmis nigricans TaxID=341454 RepID=A0A4S2MTY2_9PEZI|nr:hypothetical protein EX30DRAFT_396580 [Ascodesmis nigricans]